MYKCSQVPHFIVSGKYYRESFANHCQFKFEVFSFISRSPKVLVTFLAVGSLSLSLSVSLNLFVSVDFVHWMQEGHGGACSLHSNFLFAPALYLHCSATFGRRFRGSVSSECPATLMQSMRLLHL
ncbi:hypothetical protein IscW_ISCW016471 [Ixodes scapularis]|uniref:Uncharacterized protein n=1 Tax=Ixodes scapularis TaxID=6945 RepID=B7P152_IXOSC|nr:hypothetical protein IscW_ISCW016471 [Ixodes scapularis]|eukprot:XP_002400437.1 hypothetical protein IscW_ISCW016471 [Ixodes scapularis]